MVETADSGTIPPALRRIRDKVAIVGFAEGHRDLTPFDDPEWEVWGINRLHAQMPDKRFDRWFELHNLDMYDQDEEHKAFLRTFPGDVYIRPEDVDKLEIPNAVPYPKAAILDAFVPYFTNTVSWLIALALMMEHHTIGIWGVDMAQDTLMTAEYSAQRPSCEYFMGICSGRGINLVLPEGTDLLKATHLYGFEEPAMIAHSIERLKELDGRKDQFKRRVAEIDAERANAISAIQQLDGAMQEVQYRLKNFTPNTES